MAEKHWITAAESRRWLEISESTELDDLVREGIIGKRTMPGSRELYRAADVIAYARVMKLPAPRTEAAAR